MFHVSGQWIARTWPVILVAWVALVVGVARVAPPLEHVVETGEFAFLPEDSPSRIGERLFEQAFPNDTVASSLVVVVRRLTGDQGLKDADFDFVDSGDSSSTTDLRSRLIRIAQEQGGFSASDDDAKDPDAVARSSLVSGVHSYRDRTIGKLLRSEDSRATLVLLDLTAEFLDVRNIPLVHAVEQLLADDGFRQTVPGGLDLRLSGTAVVGRDMILAQRDSAQRTELLTVVLVVGLLIAIYRAPILALIPLITVAISVKLTMSLLCLMAQAKWVVLFAGIESYVTVLLYGAGVDYCLFLIARYKEELDAGLDYRGALTHSITQVGAAIAASAGTVICGIGMMYFAEFGKFHEAGIAISFGLVIVLVASLTFTPAVLLCAGSWAFWPQSRSAVASGTGWLAQASPLRDLQNWFDRHLGWDRVGQAILAQPARIWWISVGLMAPWAVIGAVFYSHLSYGLLSDLSPRAPSVVGTKAVADHFPAGATGPITVLLENRSVDFTDRGEDGGLAQIERLTVALQDPAVRKRLELTDVRSVSHPLGGERNLDAIIEEEAQASAPLRRATTRKLAQDRAIRRYVSQQGEHAAHVTRLDLTTEIDPFSRYSIGHLTRLQNELNALLPAGLSAGTRVLVKGPTASIRDLKAVTDRDQIRINSLVVAGVYFILVVLLRRPALCAYLMVTVLFSYLATLGVTYIVFWAMNPYEFAGLDWKVPMFLFTILIAVGEDYNIFLMTRIEEEQRRLGAVNGVIEALSRTGRIISSCGIIMAGTFASLTAGTLLGMVELGFALMFGVLLDTFVVRPILVPAYLVMLHRGQLGILSRWAGHFPEADEPPASALTTVIPEQPAVDRVVTGSTSS